MHDKAIFQCQKTVTLSNRIPTYLGLLGWAYGLAGRRDEAREVLEELLERSRREYVRPSSLVVVFIGLNEKDKALEWLERAYQERDGHLVLLKVDPGFDPLRSDPRFDDLLRWVNLVP
jgi:tetratricopeptide (TPR) repeat protein